MPTAESTPSARERILATAGRLFYIHGYHAVGVDTIIAESGVAKMTLYRHFATKDELIAACLERANIQVLELLDEAARSVDDPCDKLRAMCAKVAAIATGPQCLGCVFQMSASEFPTFDHPAHRIAAAHKRALRERLLGHASAGQLRHPEELADQLLLLVDGAWVAARMFGPHNPAATLASAAAALIRAHHPNA
jgi:AcrR family transcriptional regulator